MILLENNKVLIFFFYCIILIGEKYMKIKVSISNRHVHLTKEVYEELFNKEMVKDFEISQNNEYASTDYVTLKTKDGEIPHVRVMGPCRSYNQVEISASDAHILGLNPPVRKSGDLANSESLYVVANNREVFLPSCCILSQAHLHLNPSEAKKLNVVDDEIIDVVIDKERKGIIKAFVKVKDNGVMDLHLDRDEANAFLLKNGDEVEIRF